MDGSGAEIDGPVVVARAVHFAASATLAGALIFRAVVADPVLAREKQARLFVVDNRIRKTAWIALLLSLLSGAVLLWLQTSAMSGQPYGEALVSGALLIVIEKTQFGLVAEIRLGLTILLAICLSVDRHPLPRFSALVVSVCLVVALAWTGHAGSTPPALGYLHLAADVLHIGAAAAWTGGLVSFVLLLQATTHDGSVAASSQLDAVRRFSLLGMISVAALIASGFINAWILVSSVRGLFVTDYGCVLLAKFAAFGIMLAFAAINRFWLTPLLASPAGDAAVRRLTRNTMAEIALALFIFAIVGVLGTLHPAAHLVH
jgi:putative copper resistance protein D